MNDGSIESLSDEECVALVRLMEIAGIAIPFDLGDRRNHIVNGKVWVRK